MSSTDPYLPRSNRHGSTIVNIQHHKVSSAGQTCTLQPSRLLWDSLIWEMDTMPTRIERLALNGNSKVVVLGLQQVQICRWHNLCQVRNKNKKCSLPKERESKISRTRKEEP